MWLPAKTITAIPLVQGHQAQPTHCKLETASRKKQTQFILGFIFQRSPGDSQTTNPTNLQTNFWCWFFPRTSQLLLPYWKWLDNTPAKCKHSLYGCTTLVLHMGTRIHMHVRTHRRGHPRRHHNQSTSMCTCMQLWVQIT